MRNITAVLVFATAAPALAQQGIVLDDQPPVRHRKELRDQRFEIGPMVGSTFLDPFKRTLVGGLKVNYHLTDWIGVGAMGVFGALTMDTGLTEEIAATEKAQIRSNCVDPNDEACRSQFEIPDEDGVEWEDAQNSLRFAAAIRATFTPFSGKLGLFSRLFAEADLYVFGGLGILSFKNDAGGAESRTCGTDINGSAVACDLDVENDGLSLGPHVGLGVHVFLADWIALNFEFADTLAANNPSGRNTNESSGPNRVDADDKRFGNNMLMLFGATAHLPGEPRRSK